MGLFGSIWKGVTGPLRGIGNLVRGNVKGAIGAFGDTLRPASFVLGATGAGLPLAAGLGALSGAMQKADDPGARFSDYLKGGVAGAGTGAMGVGAGNLIRGPLRGIGGRIMGRAATPLTEEGMAAASGATAPGVGGTVGAAANPGSGVLGVLSRKPELALKAAETGVNLYGAQQAGQAAERDYRRQLELDRQRKEEEERQFRLQQMLGFTQAMQGFRPRYD